MSIHHILAVLFSLVALITLIQPLRANKLGSPPSCLVRPSQIPPRIFYSLPAKTDLSTLAVGATFGKCHPNAQLTIATEPQRRMVVALSPVPTDLELYDRLRAAGDIDFVHLLVALLRLDAMGGLFVQGRHMGALCETDWWIEALRDADLVVVRDSPNLAMHALRTDLIAARPSSPAIRAVLGQLRQALVPLWRGRAREWFGAALNEVAGAAPDCSFVLGRSYHGTTNIHVLELTPGGEVHLPVRHEQSARPLASHVHVR